MFPINLGMCLEKVLLTPDVHYWKAYQQQYSNLWQRILFKNSQVQFSVSGHNIIFFLSFLLLFHLKSRRNIAKCDVFNLLIANENQFI